MSSIHTGSTIHLEVATGLAAFVDGLELDADVAAIAGEAYFFWTLPVDADTHVFAALAIQHGRMTAEVTVRDSEDHEVIERFGTVDMPSPTSAMIAAAVLRAFTLASHNLPIA